MRVRDGAEARIEPTGPQEQHRTAERFVCPAASGVCGAPQGVDVIDEHLRAERLTAPLDRSRHDPARGEGRHDVDLDAAPAAVAPFPPTPDPNHGELTVCAESFVRRFGHALERLAFPFADPNLNMILVTSFNEWNEDTAIEPLKPAPPTRQDSSPSGDLFTQGFAFEGFGTGYLNVVRDQVVAVSGRVTDGADNPVRGIEVSAWRGEENVGRDRTDARGYYTLSRLRMPPGAYQVGVTAHAARETVVVDGRATLTGMDFTVLGHGK